MALFIQQLINGITLGSIYGLIAIGYTMVYGIIGMINFAHGDIYMIGAFNALIAFLVLGVIGVTWVPLSLLLVLVLAVVVTAVYGWTVERVAYRPLRGSIATGAADLRHLACRSLGELCPASRALQQADDQHAGGGFRLMSQDGFNVEVRYLQIGIDRPHHRPDGGIPAC
jgi:branched-chain amino acid transport system permease protein